MNQLVIETRAAEILRTAHTAGQVRKEAQKWCACMVSIHSKNKDIYRFTDGSSITVTGNAVSTKEERI